MADTPVLQTPWGGIEVADAHVHFFSPAFFRSLADQKNNEAVAGLLGWDEPTSPEALAMRWAAELERNHVARALLIASIPNDTVSVGAAIETRPDRFSAVYMANPMLPSADIRFQAASSEDQVSGVFLFPSMHHYSLHDDRVCALLQVIAGHANPLVYVHCGMLSVGFRKKLGLPCHFDMRYSNPTDLYSLASRFSRINFVIPHFGAGFLREALMVADQCPNVYLDTSSSNSWLRCQTSAIDLPGVFRKALDVLGPRRLLFGSDSSWFPRGYVASVLDLQVEILHQLGVDEETAQSVLGGNLRRLVGA
ncbi:MAG: amidohydrolase family protein [Acidobacteriota bacterium]